MGKRSNAKLEKGVREKGVTIRRLRRNGRLTEYTTSQMQCTGLQVYVGTGLKKVSQTS